MKNKLLLVSCALFLFSGTAFAENLLVTKTSGGADEEGTLPYVVANAPGGSVIELSIGDETTVTIPETILIDKNLTIDGKGKRFPWPSRESLIIVFLKSGFTNPKMERN